MIWLYSLWEDQFKHQQGVSISGQFFYFLLGLIEFLLGISEFLLITKRVDNKTDDGMSKGLLGFDMIRRFPAAPKTKSIYPRLRLQFLGFGEFVFGFWVFGSLGSIREKRRFWLEKKFLIQSIFILWFFYFCFQVTGAKKRAALFWFCPGICSHGSHHTNAAARQWMIHT